MLNHVELLWPPSKLRARIFTFLSSEVDLGQYGSASKWIIGKVVFWQIGATSPC